ncbi:hypothetical protein [Brevundimonas sanguinis]|uniref:hypothetical protein n=1 Tax=Brevundimonas sanguinis TaxID=3021811 RepID=UPI002414E93B|nr:hypothetical protein [Brevundimonas sp. NCCP 15609]
MAEMAAAAWAFVKAAFVAVGSGTATAGQVATVVAVNVAGSVALSTAASVLMKPDVGGRAPGEWLADPNAGIPFAIGDRIGVAGNIVYKNTFGKDNEYKGIVTVLSGAGPISAYLGFTADREPIGFAGEAATGRYGGEMWMQRRLGEQPDTALTSPAAITYQTLPNWGPNHRLSGKAAFMWTLRMDSKFSVYPQGEPAPITVLRGIKGYDHRYDSTMPGGSGPCRLNDRTTYRTITNPAIADLNWCLGLRENGKVVGGLGVSPAGIDWSAYTRAANVADANAWTLAAYPRSDESKSEVRAGMLQAAGAVISRRAGLVSCVTRGAPKSPVMTISAADTAGPIELDTAANVLNRYNTMTPRYLSEAHEWQLAPSAPVSSSVYVEEDRGRVRSDQRDYPYVPNAKQAAELCALDIAHSREGIAGRWPLKAYCRELEPGDVFTVNEPGLLLDGMDMLVLDRDYDPETDTPYVVFVSETPGKVAWALGQQANPSPTPALSARHDLNAPDPGAFDVVIVPPSPEGVSAPGAEVVIDIDNVRAEDLVIEIGPSFDGPWRVAKTVTINDGQLRIPVNELSPGEVFWVALSYRSADDGASPKTIKGPYTAGDLIAGDITPTAPTIVGIRNDIEAAFGDIFNVSELVGQTRADLEAADAQLSSTLGQARADLEAADATLYGNIVVLDNRAGVLETQTQSLETNKASVASLNAQIVRINDVEAVNATQALALVDLENGKVALSEYNTLKGEVVAGRDGQPSLLAKIENLKAVDLDLQQNKASVQAVSALSVRTESLEADITGLQQVTADLEAKKATSEALNAQRLRIDDVEAVNATQALALVDLENGKVALSEYNTLKGEVQAARDGAPSLLSQIQNLKSVDLDLQQNKASVASVDALTARTAHTEADIIDLENALANEVTARAEAISQVSARAGHRANLIDNPSGADDFRGWVKEGSPASYVDDDRLAGRIFVVYGYMVSQVYPAAAGDQHSLGFVASPLGDGGHVRLQYVTPSGLMEGALVLAGSAGYDVRRRSTAPSTAPAGTTGFRVVVVPPSGGVLPVWAIKVNFGSVAADFSDDYSATVLAATVAEQSLAIVDLENQQTIASWRIKSAASGSKPAIIEAVSALGGSYVAFGAEQIYFGDSTVFDDATDTMQTVVGGRVRVVAYGAPFGAANNLLEWWGPTGVALGAMNTTNGLQGRMTSLPYVFDNTINAPFVAVCNPPTSGRVVTTPGTYTSTVVTVEVTGGSGLYEYQWGYFAGSTGATATSPTGAATQINQTVASGETKSVVFLCMVRDTVTGRTTTATYRYTLTHSAA